jgi:hypothetical protein
MLLGQYAVDGASDWVSRAKADVSGERALIMRMPPVNHVLLWANRLLRMKVADRARISCPLLT